MVRLLLLFFGAVCFAWLVAQTSDLALDQYGCEGFGQKNRAGRTRRGTDDDENVKNPAP